MAQIELIMPKMGESIMEATILKWVKQVGDQVEEDETILEIATDKVDSEVPSPVSGTIQEILFQENDTVEIGKVIAIIATDQEGAAPKPTPSVAEASVANGQSKSIPSAEPTRQQAAPEGKEPEVAVAEPVPARIMAGEAGTNRFYSPLVRTIAEKENISLQELEQIEGSGVQGRVTKKDILSYIGSRQAAPAQEKVAAKTAAAPVAKPAGQKPGVSVEGNVEIVEMDRMRRLIADHMVNSKRTSPHVTSFVEADMTNIVNWRERVKKSFQERFGEKITFTPIFV